jgi:flagellin
VTTINTNLTSLFGQRELTAAQSELSSSVERLSSGLRINRAKDDNAGLGISQELQRQTRSLEVSKRNGADAISMVQTAEGALQSVGEMLQRMKELTAQGANESLSKEQRKFITAELTQLRKEINAVAEKTSFNGTKLLKSDFTQKETGVFESKLGEIQGQKYAVAADPKVKVGAKSTSTFADASIIEMTYMEATNAALGNYQFSNADESVTLTRTYEGKTSSQTLRLTTGTPSGSSDVYISPTLNSSFTLNFSELGVSTTFKITTLNAKKTAIDFANLVTSVGAVPAPTNTWRAVSGANFASGAAADPVTAIVTASGGTLRVSAATTTGLTTVSSYGAAATWTSGSASQIAFTGTVSQVNAALATLESNSPTGFGNVEIAITPQFKNSSFSSSAGTTVGTVTTYEGWQVYNQRVKLKSGATAGDNIAGFPTADNATLTVQAAGKPLNYYGSTLSSQSYTHSIQSAVRPAGDMDNALKLKNSLNFSVGDGNSVHGPYVVSRDPIEIIAGDKVTFDWRAQGGGDAFDIFAYIVRTGQDGTSGDGATQILLDEMSTNQPPPAANPKSTDWATKEVTVAQTGFYKFVFVAGANDATGGGALDAELYIDNVSVKPVAARPGTLKTANIATGGPFTVNEALKVSSVTTTGIGRFGADDGIYRLSAKVDTKTATLSQYDEDGVTLLRAQTISVSPPIDAKRYLDLRFEELGVALKLENQSNETIRLGDQKSGLASEVLMTQNRRGSLIKERGPAFQVGESSRNEIAANVFRDIRLGSNVDSADSQIFNSASTLISELENSSQPAVETFQTLHNQLENLMESIGDRRSQKGAIQNRIQSAINNVDQQLENLTAAKSQIEDTDFAWETARLTKLQIGQQASTAMLAQANAIPNVILALLE